MLNLYKLKNRSEPVGEEPNLAQPVKSKPANIFKYVNPSNGLSSGELELGLWYVKHKLLLHRLLVWLLVVVSAIIWGFSLVAWGFFLWSMPEQTKLEQQLTSFTDYSQVKLSYGAKPLQTVGTQIFNSGVNKYDAVAEVVNPNERFLVYFEYYFDFGSFKTETQKAFLLPNQTQPVVSLGIESGAEPGVPILVMTNLDWQRISNHQIKDIKTWQSYRLNFKVSDFNFIRAQSTGQAGADTHVINFKLINSSPYDYKTADFYVGLYQSEAFVGILPLRFDTGFKSLETKPVDLRSFAASLATDRVTVFPLINIYDQQVYLEPKK